jgi:hypothetical protein
VRLREREGTKTTTCNVSDLNVLAASASAYINCLNKLNNV